MVYWRTLARVSAALVAAPDCETVRHAAVSAARELLSESDITRISLLQHEGEIAVVVASEGDGADAIRGMRIDISPIPLEARARGSSRQESIDAAGASMILQATGFAAHLGNVCMTPLDANDNPMGLMVVESPAPLPADSVDALATLCAAVALGLESAQLKQDLRRQAFSDALTGLVNRACFLDRTARALEDAASTHAQAAVLFLDLDNFKVVNDSLGHASGDELLVVVAERLRHVAPSRATIARLGGDEFTVLLEQTSGADEAMVLAERVAAVLAEPIDVRGRSVRIGVSVGVAVSAPELATAGELLQAADMALYAAKTRGKSQAALYQLEMGRAAIERLELESDFRKALLRGELELYYQPIVRLATYTVDGVEALVRWHHPRRGIIGPVEFIPLAEETGLIVPLGKWVLETACAQLRDWRARALVDDDFVMSVNLSARQLRSGSLLDDVSRALEVNSLEPGCLKLEITESMAIGDTQHDRDVVDGLHALGVSLAIDDFGTGNSAVDYLRRFPVETLKIDRSFVRDLSQDRRTVAVVRGMIAFARSLDMTVTAEGVETEAEARHLLRMGCHHGQGYWFARPQSAAATEAVLSSGGDRESAAHDARDVLLREKLGNRNGPSDRAQEAPGFERIAA